MFSMCGHKQSFQSDKGRLGVLPCDMTHLFLRFGEAFMLHLQSFNSVQ